jgi:NAD(P)-dependent dehydrogenase (short-subunit alcohol dehydrogenase family)
MNTFQGRTAVITGAGSGFGLEVARIAARKGMNLVLADVQQDALDRAVAELTAQGAAVLARRIDVAKAAEVEALGHATFERFGAPHLVFNNAGVGCGGLIWESTLADWEWVLGVNLMGVAHGIRVFTPMMLAAAKADAGYEGHIVNTASMAGLQNMPNMGVYSVSKHAVVSMSETLHHDLALVTGQIAASVLCPYFIPTGIAHSQRNRPADAAESPSPHLTKSQRVADAMVSKAVSAGKLSAAEVAQLVFDAVAAKQFYIYSHPQALATVQTRLEDVVQARNPTDPFAARPEIGARLREALRDAD